MYCQTEERMEYYLVKALLTKPLFLLAVTKPLSLQANWNRGGCYMGRRRLLYGAEEVVIWDGGGCYMGRRRLLYADKPKCRKAAPSKNMQFRSTLSA